jgi:hypothetical protein
VNSLNISYLGGLWPASQGNFSRNYIKNSINHQMVTV